LKEVKELVEKLDDNIEGIIFKKYIELESVVKVAEYMNQNGYKNSNGFKYCRNKEKVFL